MDYPGNGDFRGRRDATVWQQLNRILRGLLVIVSLLVMVSLFLPQHKRLKDSRSEVEGLDAQVTEQKMQLARLTREVSWLKTDPAYLEIIARDRLGRMKEGETIVLFGPPPGERK
ncbi:hypothetical protein BH20VER1_BH20VER1_31220 [soil metagenome]